jgi:hypothetical protein
MRNSSVAAGVALVLSMIQCQSDGGFGSVQVRLTQASVCTADGAGGFRLPNLIESMRVDLERKGMVEYSVEWGQVELAGLCASGSDLDSVIDTVHAGKYNATLFVLDTLDQPLNDVSTEESYLSGGNTAGRVVGVPVHSGQITPLTLRGRIGQGKIDLEVVLDNPTDFEDSSAPVYYDRCATSADCPAGSACLVTSQGFFYCSPQCVSSGDCPSKEGTGAFCMPDAPPPSTSHCWLTCPKAGIPAGCPSGMLCKDPNSAAAFGICIWQ